MNKIKSLQVFYNDKKVGTLALMKNNIVAFEYDNEWLNNGFSISPYSLPLKKQVFIPKIDLFDGLYGVFSDSLPDGWGRLLVDRMLNSQNINPREINPISRLAIVGETGMGALSYRPEYNLLENKDYQGSGMGLYITKLLLDAKGLGFSFDTSQDIVSFKIFFKDKGKIIK